MPKGFASRVLHKFAIPVTLVAGSRQAIAVMTVVNALANRLPFGSKLPLSFAFRPVLNSLLPTSFTLSAAP